MTNPVDTPELYDVFYLAGLESPGICAFTGLPTLDLGWEPQQPKGSDGGATVRGGTKLVEFEVSIRLWRDAATGIDHFAMWDTFKSILDTPIAKNASKALDIYHPQLEGLGIGSVVVKSKTEPAPNGDGTATAKIKFLQYKPAKKKAGATKPGGSKGGGSGGTADAAQKPDPNQDIKDEVASLTSEFNAA